jgi:16S rRNA (cytidine1402-2'-O)-methyltransferase
MTCTRVAGRVGAQDNAAAATITHAMAQTARRAWPGIVEVKRNGARMAGEETELRTANETHAFRAEPGSLYVVATPIGNLRDVTLRALDILRSVDAIRAEDTRVTATLLARYGIATRPRALHQHNETREIAAVLADLAAGRSVALVSDAGTPAISDPGARLVRAVADAGHRVVPIPGASAVAAAVCAAGLTGERFMFIGFLPAQTKARRQLLETLASLDAALVIYEAPHRIAATLGDLVHALDGRRMLTIARELTKTFETLARMPLADGATWLDADANRKRGEFVVVVDVPVAGGAEALQALTPESERMLSLLLEELPPARAARVAAAVARLPRDVLYARALALQAKSREQR